MAVIRFIQPDNTEQTIEVPPGGSVMQAALEANVRGIIAECGGSAMCGTCHVYVEESFLPQLKPADRVEEEILEAMVNRCPNSRLSCQIRIEEVPDGLVVHVPTEQGSKG